jgi:hypothetical protein
MHRELQGLRSGLSRLKLFESAWIPNRDNLLCPWQSVPLGAPKGSGGSYQPPFKKDCSWQEPQL